MATITIEIPPGVEQKLLDSFEIVYGLPEGLSKEANMRRHIYQFMVDVHRQAHAVFAENQSRTAAEQARNQALERAELEASQIQVI